MHEVVLVIILHADVWTSGVPCKGTMKAPIWKPVLRSQFDKGIDDDEDDNDDDDAADDDDGDGNGDDDDDDGDAGDADDDDDHHHDDDDLTQT